MSKYSLEEILLRLKSRDLAERLQGANAVGNQGETGAIEALILSLNDPEVVVRLAAASSLGKLRDRRSIGALIDYLSTSVDRVVRAVIESEQSGPNRGATLMEFLSDWNTDFGMAAIDALAQFPDAETFRGISRLLKQKKGLAHVHATTMLARWIERAPTPSSDQELRRELKRAAGFLSGLPKQVREAATKKLVGTEPL